MLIRPNSTQGASIITIDSMGGVDISADNAHELLSEPKVRGFDFVDFECVCVFE